MIRINLLPVQRFKRKENVRLQVAVAILGIPLVVVLVLGYWSTQLIMVKELLTQKEVLKTEWNIMQQRLEILNIQKQTNAILEQRVNVITDLIKQRSGPIYLLDELINRTPANEVWLTELRQQKETVNVEVEVDTTGAAKKKSAQPQPADGDGLKAKVDEKITPQTKTKQIAAVAKTKLEQREVDVLTLSGVAKDNQAVANYIKSLENSKIFSNVRLIKSSQVLIAEFKLSRFSLKANIDYLATQEDGPAKKG